MLSAPPHSPAPLGVSGRLAALFVDSKLTPLIIIASLLLGLFAVILTPREEEPQIVVPMADVWLSFPGASAKVVEEQLTKPIERKLSEIKTVEYVYSISRPGGALIIVRFYVGEPMEQSLVDLYDKLMSNQDLLPPGAQPFQVKPRDVNDVPIVTLTLSSERYTDFQLRQLGDRVLEDAKKVPGTASWFRGGRSRPRVACADRSITPEGLWPDAVAGGRRHPGRKPRVAHRPVRKPQ
jgi:multidrug efflux pump subunit AcrB